MQLGLLSFMKNASAQMFWVDAKYQRWAACEYLNNGII